LQPSLQPSSRHCCQALVSFCSSLSCCRMRPEASIALCVAWHLLLSFTSDLVLTATSSLAHFQQFTDEMTAKYEQAPATTAAPTGATGTDTTQDTVTQVAGAGGANHDAGVTAEDGQTIVTVIGFLQAMEYDTLLPAHKADNVLQGECQKRLDICEEPNPNVCDGDGQSVGAGGSLKKHLIFRDMDVGRLRHAEIGSELTQGSPDGVSTLQVGHAKSVLSPNGQKIAPDRSSEDDLATQPDGEGASTVNLVGVPVYVGTATSCTGATCCFPQSVEPAHYTPEGAQLSDGVGVVSGFFGSGAPWIHTLTDTTQCGYMTNISTTGLAARVDQATMDSSLVVTDGTREFDQLASNAHDSCSCGSLYTAKTEFGLRHKACREHHQKPACAAQNCECPKYDDCRLGTDSTCPSFPTCALDGTPNSGGALRDEYISMEWWFKERRTMENCLTEVARWFEPLWDKYILCDDAIKKCAEATLTCDNIQMEFEAKHCQYDVARKQACDAHYACYDIEVQRCAETCDLVQTRVQGRKAEYEIIQRIICMLRALLANNDEHFDAGENKAFDGSSNSNLNNQQAVDTIDNADGTGSFRRAGDASSDHGTKSQRLAACKSMVVDSNGYNLVCQGPKKKTSPSAGGAFEKGDDVAHYRAWPRELGGEYPRLPMDMNSAVASCTQNDDRCFVDTIVVDKEDWKGGSDEKVGNGDGTTSVPYHRVDGHYTPWGFDCDFSARPCTRKFVQTNYDFLRTDTSENMERASCQACAIEDFQTGAYRSDSDATNTATDVCSGQSQCACFNSRDGNFCTECASNCGSCSNYCAHINNNPSTVWQTDAEVPVQAAIDWDVYPGTNAHARGCGADNLDTNTPTVSSLDECKNRCIAFSGCTGILHISHSSACYLRNNFDISQMCSNAHATMTVYVMKAQ